MREDQGPKQKGRKTGEHEGRKKRRQERRKGGTEEGRKERTEGTEALNKSLWMCLPLGHETVNDPTCVALFPWFRPSVRWVRWGKGGWRKWKRKYSELVVLGPENNNHILQPGRVKVKSELKG